MQDKIISSPWSIGSRHAIFVAIFMQLYLVINAFLTQLLSIVALAPFMQLIIFVLLLNLIAYLFVFYFITRYSIKRLSKINTCTNSLSKISNYSTICYAAYYLVTSIVLFSILSITLVSFYRNYYLEDFLSTIEVMSPPLIPVYFVSLIAFYFFTKGSLKKYFEVIDLPTENTQLPQLKTWSGTQIINGAVFGFFYFWIGISTIAKTKNKVPDTVYVLGGIALIIFPLIMLLALKKWRRFWASNLVVLVLQAIAIFLIVTFSRYD